MSDYLANIAERLLTNDPAIRPRPLSVFEPFQAMGTAGFAQQPRAEQDHRLTESDAVGAVNPAPIAMTVQGAPVDHGEKNTIAVHSPRSSLPAVMTDPQPVAPTTVKRPAGQAVRRRDPIDSPPEHALSIGIGVPRVERLPPVIKIRSKPLVESSDGQEPAGTSRPFATKEEIDIAGREPVIPGRRSELAGKLPESTLLKPTIERTEMEKPIAAQIPKQPLATRPSRLESTWGKKNDPMEKEISTPTINVTIGRIEVRAAAAPVPSQPKSRSPNIMGLDEYLHKRNGGGR